MTRLARRRLLGGATPGASVDSRFTPPCSTSRGSGPTALNERDALSLVLEPERRVTATSALVSVGWFRLRRRLYLTAVHDHEVARRDRPELLPEAAISSCGRMPKVFRDACIRERWALSALVRFHAVRRVERVSRRGGC